MAQPGELASAPELVSPDQPLIIPVLEEQVRIGQEVVETGRVRVQKQIHETTRTLDLPTLYQTVEVERVPIDRVVDKAPEARYEGNVLVIPVVREEVITQTRLVLVEEVRLRNSYRTEVVSEPVTLRHETVVVSRQSAE
jgi:uncharacterized protein (TIGR02271 family)